MAQSLEENKEQQFQLLMEEFKNQSQGRFCYLFKDEAKEFFSFKNFFEYAGNLKTFEKVIISKRVKSADPIVHRSNANMVITNFARVFIHTTSGYMNLKYSLIICEFDFWITDNNCFIMEQLLANENLDQLTLLQCISKMRPYLK